MKAAILIESWDGSMKTKSQILEAISHLDIIMKEDIGLGRSKLKMELKVLVRQIQSLYCNMFLIWNMG